MYVDLSGYTALSATLDPEDTHRLLHRFFERVDRIVVGYGGTIDKHIGDSVMALFGAPVAHGNDPQRAVRAALDIHAAMPALGSELKRPIQVHLGIALGEVVASGLGSVAHSAYTVTGDAANLAARLMERAGPGETLVTEALRLATEDVATFDALDRQQLKGISNPEPIHRLTGLRTDIAAERPMVGRQRELAQLLAMLDFCRSGRGGAIAVRGVPGIGKSRLIRELMVEAVARGFFCVKGTELDFGAHRGGDALAAITSGLLGCAAAGESAKFQVIDQACALGHLDESDRPFVHDLLGLPPAKEDEAIHAAMNAEARQSGKASVLAKLLRLRSRDTPCLIVVEDVHWASATTLRLLAQLAVTAAEAAATVVMTTRFDGDPFDATWRAQSGGALSATLDLRPLLAEDAIGLASGVITDIDEFARECVARAEGNPLFLEQLLRSRLADSQSRLPHSLQGVVLARLDSLPVAERRALQAASVLGQRFTTRDLQAVLGSADVDCQPMIARHLLRPDREGYLFAHALIRDGVYASLTRESKRAMHLKAATAFAGRDPPLYAEHLDRAEDPAAARAYLHAAESEAAAFRLESANVLVTRGLELAVGDDDLVKLGLTAGKLRLDSGQAMPARDAYAGAVSAATEPGDRCKALIGLAAAYRMSADLDRALEHLAAAEEIAADSASTLSEIHYMRGNLHFARGQGAACLREHRLALGAAKRANAPEWKARARSGLGDAAYLQGRLATARRHFERCVELAEKHDLLRIISANRCMIGTCLAYELKFEEALAQIEEGRKAAIRIGDRFAEMFAIHIKTDALLLSGRLRDAEGPNAVALALMGQLGARRYEAFARLILAMLHIQRDEMVDARRQSDLAMEIAQATGLGFCGPIICSVQALVCGQGLEGRAWIERGREMLQQTGLLHNHVLYRKLAIDWAIDAGDWALVERLRQELIAYATQEPLAYINFFVDRAGALAALAREPGDMQAMATLEKLASYARAVDLRL